MLVENTFSKGEILSLKFHSGEEVIASFVRFEGSDLIVQNPLVVIMTNHGEIKFAPWMVSIDQNLEISINKNKMLYYTKTRQEVKALYLK